MIPAYYLRDLRSLKLPKQSFYRRKCAYSEVIVHIQAYNRYFNLLSIDAMIDYPFAESSSCQKPDGIERRMSTRSDQNAQNQRNERRRIMSCDAPKNVLDLICAMRWYLSSELRSILSRFRRRAYQLARVSYPRMCIEIKNVSVHKILVLTVSLANNWLLFYNHNKCFIIIYCYSQYYC